MKGMVKLTLGFVAALVIAISQAKADVIVYYSFNTSPFVNADIGSTLSSFSGFSQGTAGISFPAGSALNNQVGFAAGNAVRQNGWDGGASYWQFTLNSSAGSGWQDIGLSFAANRTSTGPTGYTLRYSSNGGGSFTDFTTFTITTAFAIHSANLSAVSALNNNASVVFRLVGSGTTAGAGSSILDNFTISATAIPEPSTIALVGFGLLGAMLIRRRR